MVQTARISFIIHIPFVSQYKPVITPPTTKQMISSNRIMPNRASFSRRFLRRQRVYELQTITPIVPIRLPTTFRVMLVTLGKQQAKIEARMTTRLKTMMNVLVMLMPNPLQDQARLYIEEAVMAIVQKQMRTNRPHSKGLQNQSGRQLTKYWKLSCWSSYSSTIIQFIQFLPFSPHPLLTKAAHFSSCPSFCLQSICQSTLLYFPTTLAMRTPSVSTIQDSWLVSLQMQSLGIKQEMSVLGALNSGWIMPVGDVTGTQSVALRMKMEKLRQRGRVRKIIDSNFIMQTCFQIYYDAAGQYYAIGNPNSIQITHHWGPLRYFWILCFISACFFVISFKVSSRDSLGWWAYTRV